MTAPFVPSSSSKAGKSAPPPVLCSYTFGLATLSRAALSDGSSAVPLVLNASESLRWLWTLAL